MANNVRAVIIIAILLGFIGQQNPVSAETPRRIFFDKATLVSVEEGNIVRLNLKEKRVTVLARLIGVGAPDHMERLDDFGPSFRTFLKRRNYTQKARRFVKKILQGKTIEVWTRKHSALDSQRRLLVCLKVPDGNDGLMDVNAHVIKKGMGFVARDYVHVTYARYKRLERQARMAGLGIWRGLDKSIILGVNRK